MMSINEICMEFRRWFALQRISAKGYLKSFRIPEKPMNQPIDFVVTWVDGNDPAWRAEKALYTPSSVKGNSNARYREWNQFMYWFRAVEKYAPWVRYVHLVTWGHLPPWLNTNHPKLKIVNHKDYIPEKYLPTFSSIPIELNIHRIPGLSEHFVYFCDDFYLSRPVDPDDFFCGGLPRYSAIADPVRNYRYNGPFVHQQFSDIGLINGCFDICSSMEAHPELWFSKCYGRKRMYNRFAYSSTYLSGMTFTHLGTPYRKSILEKVWNECYSELDDTCTHRFRTPLDYMHQVFSLWEIMSGTFVPVSEDYYGIKFGTLSRETTKIETAFSSRKHRMICLNDSIDITEDNFMVIKLALDNILERTFPEKSSFEK